MVEAVFLHQGLFGVAVAWQALGYEPGVAGLRG